VTASSAFEPPRPAPRVLADLASSGWVAQAALVLAGAVLVGLSAQVAIPLPFTPVPLTLQTYAVLVVGGALGSARGAAALALYAVAGIAGVPWFSDGGSGLTVPTLGYIVGFIAAGAVVGRLVSGHGTGVVRTIAAMIIGSAVIYACGVTWLALSLGIGPEEALAKGLWPFLIGDALKAAAAGVTIPLAWRALSRWDPGRPRR